MSKTNLGIYPDRGALDHDIEMRLNETLNEMCGAGVDYAAALASIKRVARELR